MRTRYSERVGNPNTGSSDSKVLYLKIEGLNFPLPEGSSQSLPGAEKKTKFVNALRRCSVDTQATNKR
jgi:hypothetical protein